MNGVLKVIEVIFANILSFAIWYGMFVVYMFNAPRVLHIFQQEGYKFKDYTRWISKNVKRAFAPGCRQLIATVAFYFFIILFNLLIAKTSLINSIGETGLIITFFVEAFALMGVFYASNIVQIVRDKKERKNAKKKLVYTSRAKRLMFWNFFVVILLYLSFMGQFLVNEQSDASLLFFLEMAYVFVSIMIALLPINMLFASYFAWPGEMGRQRRYISKAAKIINKCEKANGLIRIGITGSYGKTSTKFILKTILSEKYKVLATPESYNTTMGNVKVIREQLKVEEGYEVFISEMGARYKRDISSICEFVRPNIGIITSIGPQHLETFKNIDNIVATKAELINSLAADGVVVLPRDNEYCQKLYNKETRKKYCYTLKNTNADVYAKDISMSAEGCKFTAVTSIGEIKCISKLLGEHNIENILGCITIAVHLGLTKEEIERGVSRIEPVEHRLQIINNNNGTIVIDDAFNSNPVGSKMALDVLKEFDGRKIVITPGMVELGDEEKNENKKFGKHMADVTDIAILVGMKRSEPIVEGLREGKFDEMNIFVVPDLAGATKKLGEISKVGDVILFENDLPDSYNE